MATSTRPLTVRSDETAECCPALLAEPLDPTDAVELAAVFKALADPVRLQRYGLTLRDVYERIRENNSNFGGGFIEHGAEMYTVRGLGRTQTIGDLERIVLLSRAGTPVLIKDVAQVTIGAMPRQGAVTRDGKGETVSGMAIMLKGENGKNVIQSEVRSVP